MKEEECEVNKVELQIKQLKSEVEKLQRRKKILEKRIKRLYEENNKLADELDSLEAEKESKFPRPKAARVKFGECPKCGGELEYLAAGPKTIIMCKVKLCTYRSTK